MVWANRVVPPRTTQSEGGHTHHDQLGIEYMELLPTQPEPFDYARRVVLHQYISRINQAFEGALALGSGEVEGNPPFADIGGVEDRAPLPPPLLGGGSGAGEPHLIGL